MDYDSKRKVTVMFGGFTEHDYYNELWVYDQKTNLREQKIQSNMPSGRGAPGFVYDEKNDQFILFGGFSELGFFNDTWIYDPEDNTWTEISTPETPPQVRTRMVYDKNNQVAVFFGGDFVESEFYDEVIVSSPYSKTWMYDSDNNSWMEIITEIEPSARGLNGIVYDQQRNSLVIFGGVQIL